VDCARARCHTQSFHREVNRRFVRPFINASRISLRLSDQVDCAVGIVELASHIPSPWSFRRAGGRPRSITFFLWLRGGRGWSSLLPQTVRPCRDRRTAGTCRRGLRRIQESTAFHAGMDECFTCDDKCPRCGGRDKAELFAGEVRTIRDHLEAKEESYGSGATACSTERPRDGDVGGQFQQYPPRSRLDPERP